MILDLDEVLKLVEVFFDTGSYEAVQHIARADLNKA
jgi:hypothetical protein